MASLDRNLRSELESAVKKARRVSESAARDAIQQLAVHHHEPWPSLSPADKQLRNRLRAHGRQLGDTRDERKGTQGIERLASECAYEHWHRLLFARFLAENDLLIESDSGMPLSLDECRELARERGLDWLALASGFAQRMLPQIFRANDPVLDVALPAERREELELLLESLPAGVFTADDSLGWVYQFWQSDRKDEVNASEKKIGAQELAPVTQLFTEDYMVLYLLHNTLGAWWAAKRKAEGKDHVLPGCEWTYLRWRQDGMPAAGCFAGWPREAKSLTVLDPCMGSGHFLVFALPLLVAMRMEDEGLSREEAIDAVLADNLYGLELDARCTQIAAFNLALAAWKMGGYRPLPSLNVACSGLGINAREQEWVKLAGREARHQEPMRELYRLFEQAPILGSLIDPRRTVKRDLLSADFDDVEELLEKALEAERGDEESELTVTAKGLLEAASILARQFTLVVTNVPFLGRGKQCDELAAYVAQHYPDSQENLATAFLDRSLRILEDGGTAAVVIPTNWLLQKLYAALRKCVLSKYTIDFVATLGAKAFQTPMWDFSVCLSFISNVPPSKAHVIGALDCSDAKSHGEKALSLRQGALVAVPQDGQAFNPDAKIILAQRADAPLLSSIATSYQGIKSGDDGRVRRRFWEFSSVSGGWRFIQSTVATTRLWGGLEGVIDWRDGGQGLARRQGMSAWGKRGVMVSQMGGLPVSLYSGEVFDSNGSPVVVDRVDAEPAVLAALWAFVSDSAYASRVREIDRSLKPTNTSLTLVPFERHKWAEVAADTFPEGLPAPHSDDPTQWLFDGRPRGSKAPLHVAVARLVGYRWPRQSGSAFVDCPTLAPDGLESHADVDGIVCLPPLRGEASASDRLMALLGKAYGADWSAEALTVLLKQVGAGSLHEWLRDSFFEQHCNLFHQRPFIWHVWDGLRDGFSALVNYHKLTGPGGEGRRTLESLAYRYIGEWIARKKAEVAADVDGAELKVAAAVHLKEQLEKILEGEPPYDIFVRWKPLREQPVGWDPDVNDGVRVNIRPFMTAKPVRGKGSILRCSPSIKWGKDKGNEPERPKAEYPWFWGWDGETQDFLGGGTFDGSRWNDLHYSCEAKLSAARSRKRGATS